MLRRLLLKIAGKIVARPIRRRIAAFQEATKNPESLQSALLEEIMRSQADTAYGREHHFGTIRTLADFRGHVPINTYENLSPYIQRMMNGETNVLVSDPEVLMFALTSGTTAARKHIPITRRYLDDYRRGWNIWGLTAMRAHPAIKLKPVMQLVGDPEEYKTEAGIPCGNLSGFTAAVQKRIIRFLYSVPAIAGKIKDSPTRYYVALRFSIPRQVGLLSSANPSTLVALARVMDREKESLIRDIADGTLNSKLDLPTPIRDYLSRKAKRNQKAGGRTRIVRPPRRNPVAKRRLAAIDNPARLLDGGQRRALPSATLEILCRHAGPRYWPARQRRPLHDSPAELQPFRCSGHHHALFRVHSGSGNRFAAADGAGCPRGRGRQSLLHPADDQIGPLPIPHFRLGAGHRLSESDAADRIPRQGQPLRQLDRRKALGASRYQGDGSGGETRAAADHGIFDGAMLGRPPTVLRAVYRRARRRRS